MTSSLMFISFLANLICFGDSYGLAHILPDASFIPAAWQISVKNSLSAAWIVLVIMLLNAMTRKNGCIVGLFLITLGTFVFAFAGSVDPPRSFGREMLFQ